MEFFLVALLGLVFLFLGSIALVELGFITVRLWSYLLFWWHWHRSHSAQPRPDWTTLTEDEISESLEALEA